MKLNLMTILVITGVVLVTLKFRTQLTETLGKVPLVGDLIA